MSLVGDFQGDDKDVALAIEDESSQSRELPADTWLR